MKIEKKTYDEREVIEAARVFADPVSPYYDPEIADNLYATHPHWFELEQTLH